MVWRPSSNEIQSRLSSDAGVASNDPVCGGTHPIGIELDRDKSQSSAKSVRIAAGVWLHFSMRLKAIASENKYERRVAPYKICWARLGRIGELQWNSSGLPRSLTRSNPPQNPVSASSSAVRNPIGGGFSGGVMVDGVGPRGDRLDHRMDHRSTLRGRWRAVRSRHRRVKRLRNFCGKIN